MSPRERPSKRAWPRIEDVHTIVFDFDGIFTDNKVYIADDGSELVRCDRADGLGIDLLRAYGRRRRRVLDILILSRERNRVVQARARKLGLRSRRAVVDKLSFLQNYLRRRHPAVSDPFAGLLYAGNDLNDLPLIARAGFSVAPADAHPLVRQTANAVLPIRGGEGFVRGVVERLLGVSTMSAEEIYELVLDSGDWDQPQRRR